MKNIKEPAFGHSFPGDEKKGWDSEEIPGLTKQEYTCIKLGIPESGDEDIDALIRKANRMRIAEKAMQGLLTIFYDPVNSEQMNIVPNLQNSEYMALLAVQSADCLLKQLNP